MINFGAEVGVEDGAEDGLVVKGVENGMEVGAELGVEVGAEVFRRCSGGAPELSRLWFGVKIKQSLSKIDLIIFHEETYSKE